MIKARFQYGAMGDGSSRSFFRAASGGTVFIQRLRPSLEPALSQARPGTMVAVPIRAAIQSGGPAKTGMPRYRPQFSPIPANGGISMCSIFKSPAVQYAGVYRASGRTVIFFPVSLYAKNSCPERMQSASKKALGYRRLKASRRGIKMDRVPAVFSSFKPAGSASFHKKSFSQPERETATRDGPFPEMQIPQMRMLFSAANE